LLLHFELGAKVEASGSRAHADNVHRDFVGREVMKVNSNE
jgi:hypothetical protein